MMQRTRLTLALACPALVIALMSGCSTGGSTSDKPAASDSAAAPSEEAEAEADNGISAFGQTFEYDDGLAVSVSVPEPFTPSPSAAGADLAQNVVFKITLTNGTEETFEPLEITSVTSGGTEGSTIFDTGNAALPGDGLGPTGTTLLAGQSITWSEAWSVADANDLTVTVQPSPIDYDKAIFTAAG